MAAALLLLCLFFASSAAEEPQLSRCPDPCRCTGLTLDCSHRGLRAVPRPLPQDARRLADLVQRKNTVGRAERSLLGADRMAWTDIPVFGMVGRNMLAADFPGGVCAVDQFLASLTKPGSRSTDSSRSLCGAGRCLFQRPPSDGASRIPQYADGMPPLGRRI
ncbi:hypothetical protein HPB49_012983 [Dermacentor silvarum]|uniref:Uncharacterized protein n=1 Tax=Dermacentor silvarum TaxID=543639 RepID=A0ACB8E170_DERSI|nr:hypothetical protein HPB49_012983 [Dermacentor silvarum]